MAGSTNLEHPKTYDISNYWKKVVTTEGVHPDYFMHYERKQEGIVKRVAMNLRACLPSSSPIAPPKQEKEKSFYFCIGCKKGKETEILSIFKQHHKSLHIVETTTCYQEEVGIMIWLTLNKKGNQDLKSILKTICDPEILKSEPLPKIIADELQAKASSLLALGN